MADNATVNTNTGASGATPVTVAADDVGGVLYPRVKIATGADGSATDVSTAAPMPCSTYAHEAAFVPGLDGDSPIAGQLNTDPEGNLCTRGAVFTDEDSFRVNFANSSLAVSVGSPTRSGAVFSGGSLGTAGLDLHVGDYIKYDADAESAWAQVIDITGTTASVAAYTGSATSGAASRALVKPFTGSGGTIAVASGVCTLASGTTINAVTGVLRDVDYSPLVGRSRATLSQRIANQDFILGFEENASAPRWFARFRFTGTTNTAVICETARNPTQAPNASETQTSTVVLSNGKTSAVAIEYRVEMLTERVVFYVDNKVVAEHTITIPGQYDEMSCVARWVNAGSAPATTSTATIDFLAAKNHDKLETGVMSQNEQIVAAVQPMQAFSFSQAGVIAINTDLLVIDCQQFQSVSIQCTLMGTAGVITPQWSDDPAFSVITGCQIQNPVGTLSSTFTAAGLGVVAVVARYLRLRLTTATTAGTTTLSVNGMAAPLQPWLVTQPISGTVTVGTPITPGTAAANLGKAEDAAAASGDTGLFVLGVRRDALTVSASAAADYNELATDRFGALLIRSFEKLAKSYSAASAAVTPAATPTDIWDFYGNATTTVVVTRIRITATQTTAGSAAIALIKRSAAQTGGTRTASTAVPLDATDAAASSAPGTYTVNPTGLGTAVGNVRNAITYIPAPATANPSACGIEWNFGDKGKGITLSGTGQGIAINLNGVTLTGGSFMVEVDWYEY